MSAYNVGDLGLIHGLGRSPGEGNGNPLQYSCLENPWTEEPGKLQSMGSQSWTRLSDFSFTFVDLVVTLTSNLYKRYNLNHIPASLVFHDNQVPLIKIIFPQSSLYLLNTVSYLLLAIHSSVAFLFWEDI